MRAWLAIVRVGALHHFAWRLDVLSVLASSWLVLAVNHRMWEVAASAPEGLPIPRDEVLTYVVVAWTASRITATRLDEDLGQRVRSGQVVTDLLKPIELRTWLLLRDLGRALAMSALVGAPLLGGAALGGMGTWPGAWSTWLAFGVSVSLGVLVGGHLSLLLGLAAVRLRSAAGLISLKEVGIALVSGALIPLDVLPEAARDALLLLPFQALAHAPAEVLLEQGGGVGMARVIGGQALWAVGLAAASRLAWRRLSRELTVEGG